MEAKDKAKALVSEFYSLISGMELSFISKMIVFPNGDSHYETAKQCALKECRDTLNVLQDKWTELDFWADELIEEIRYYEEVEQEINQL